MPDTYTYHITRNCLRHGRFFLPPSVRSFFPREGRVSVSDSTSGKSYELTLLDAVTIAGLGAFYAAHALEPNDRVVIARDGDSYTLTPQSRPRLADYTRPELQQRLLDRVVEQAPLSEREIRSTFADLPSTFDLAGLLSQDPRLQKYEGRWQVAVDEPGGTSPSVTVSPRAAPPPDWKGAALVSALPHQTTDTTLSAQARSALTTFGFRLESPGAHQLLAHADLGRRHYSVLVHLLTEHTQLDWSKLSAQRRALKVNHLSVFGHHHDLLRLQAPATQARTSLWSWQSLARALDLVAAVPVSPVDLEPFFARDGLFEEGLRRFERMIEKRVDSRGHFSSVLQRLASLRAPSIFLLEDIMVDTNLSRDQVLGILLLLNDAPFHLVSRVDSGEFCLRQGVHENLLHLSDYALSLTQRLPERRTEQLRGQASTTRLKAEGADDAVSAL